ncbi:ATPase [Rubneribacter badeniensis]|uniref:ATPase n=1 Tax=Rubneribacter badeniensis TaxID=2070688 RepID=A0A2K2U6V0_9ACTN|nr:AAA family ATPase [Rubneribacter badeniensis]PNV66046.1 ATPase [Rubneribacter badeniensis]
MALTRSIYSQFEAWKEAPRHGALLVAGARQVGKTFLIRQFARENYEVLLEINFVETPSAKSIFEGDLDAETLIANLTAFSGTALKPGGTLVFLDEVQECPKARTAIKFLVDDGRFDYIESGSLLGVLSGEVPSLPVGYEQMLRMHPLSLTEFFLENGVQQETLDLVRRCCEEGRPVPTVAHKRLMRLFRLYLAVGGMPAAVQEFVETSDLARVLRVQRDIVGMYRQDIAKYAADKAHVHMIFDALPAELDKKNKRFKLSDLAKSARMERYASDFMWLVDAGVALPCYNAVAPQAPLAVNARHNLFKLFLCDVGLLSAASVGAVQFDLVQGDVSVNWGSFLENALAQELAVNGFDLFYYDKSKIGEVDFLIQKGSRVIPLEAKSGVDYAKHVALDNLMAVGEWQLGEAMVLCRGNVERCGRITYLPWYAAAFLKQDALPERFIVEA